MAPIVECFDVWWLFGTWKICMKSGKRFCAQRSWDARWSILGEREESQSIIISWCCIFRSFGLASFGEAWWRRRLDLIVLLGETHFELYQMCPNFPCTGVITRAWHLSVRTTLQTFLHTTCSHTIHGKFISISRVRFMRFCIDKDDRMTTLA